MPEQQDGQSLSCCSSDVSEKQVSEEPSAVLQAA